jgi:hypothetical protein
MGSLGLERAFAMGVGGVLILLGLGGLLGTPLVGGPEDTGIIVTGFGHDLLHLVSGALFVHVGLALNGRNRALGLMSLGALYLVSGLLSFISADLLGLYDAPTSGFDQLGHLLLGVAALVVGWSGRADEKREFGRSVSRPIRQS